MKRFSYAPKVYAFVRSNNMDGKIYDLSDDLVSGTITRNINQLSSAELVLRNRFKKWLADPVTGKAILLPMDMITIWMQRVAGKPIQVFTGYLDSVPYDQMFPGNATITASCTLKRLGIQRFDPGLQFFRNFALSQGWTIDPTTGTATNFDLFTQNSNPGADPNIKSKVNDGGFAQLIYQFMTQIAGWNSRNVLVDNLPANLPKRAAALYAELNKEVEVDLQHLEEYMGRIMGVDWSPVNGVKADGSLVAGVDMTISELRKKASEFNIPIEVLLAAGLVLTGFNATQSTDPNFGSVWGYGLFAARPKTTLVQGGSPDTSNVQAANEYRGFTKDELLKPKNAAEAFIRDLMDADTRVSPDSGQAHPYLTQARKGNVTAIQKWITLASGRPVSDDIFAENYKIAQRWAKIYNADHNIRSANKTAAIPVTSPHLTWKSQDVKDLAKTKAEKTAYRTFYQNRGIFENAPIFWYIKKNYPTTVLWYQSGQRQEELWIGGDAVTLSLVKKDLEKNNNQNFKTIDWDNFYAGQQTARLKILGYAGAKYPTWSGFDQAISNKINSEPTSKETDVSRFGLNFQQFGQISLDAAFAAQFAFPTDLITSELLTGQKSLMNDVTCLEGVQQFCQASLRAFMSLPDGRFFAFYPDYFGANGRGPYWPIFDIEITNMGIRLNDDALATHVFVVGDTFGLDGQIDIFDRLASRGVATIAQAFMLDSFIVPEHEFDRRVQEKRPSFGRLKDAYDFLQLYGARVYKEEQPLIRNSFYEFMYAWQRFMQKWSEQFATVAEFTFQPEVLAGGIIGFPQHNLQMFVESVTHTFDYTSGFNTSAVLTSPAAISDTRKGVGRLPGFALAGNINTFGSTQ